MAKKEGGKGGKKKGGASPGGFVDTRKPKHSKDANRPSKSDKGMRDAATVSLWARLASWQVAFPLLSNMAAWRMCFALCLAAVGAADCAAVCLTSRHAVHPCNTRRCAASTCTTLVQSGTSVAASSAR